MTNVDRKAFHQLTYGLFLLSARKDERDNACIINTAIQAASEPRQISICCIKGNCAQQMIDATGEFCVSVLGQSTPKEYFEHFGLQSGNNVDKFEPSVIANVPGLSIARAECGLVYEQNANAFFACKVVSSENLGSHIQYIGEVQEAKRLSDEPSITYGYYMNVTKKGGSASAAANPTVAEAGAVQQGQIVAWKCEVCGYIFESTELPDDFICPLCKHGAEDFAPVYAQEIQQSSENSPEEEANGDERTGEIVMTKWVCTVCGYIYEGEQPPAECPVCHAGADKFKKVEGEMTLAAEHEYGIYAKTVKNNPDIDDETKKYIFDQLKANFDGECSEVGMYLCMARIAHREGYPEIGLYWEKAAYEEAEHAAKFAELLGEDLESNMKADTKANLAWRVECEYGATQGKTDLAVCAKKNNLDAIHDTVHEMARDEARHGKALAGLLKRYFG